MTEKEYGLVQAHYGVCVAKRELENVYSFLNIPYRQEARNALKALERIRESLNLMIKVNDEEI